MATGDGPRVRLLSPLLLFSFLASGAARSGPHHTVIARFARRAVTWTGWTEWTRWTRTAKRCTSCGRRDRGSSPLLLLSSSPSSLLLPLLSPHSSLLFSRTTCLLRPRRSACRKTPGVSRLFGSRTHLFLDAHISLSDVLRALDLGVACRRFMGGGTPCRAVLESQRGRPSQALTGALSARSSRRNAPSGAPSDAFQSRRVAVCRGIKRLRPESPAGQAGGR
jgi:hypothetical protein